MDEDGEPHAPLQEHWRRHDTVTKHVQKTAKRNKKLKEAVVVEAEEVVAEDPSPRWSEYHCEAVDLSIPEPVDVLEE